MEKFEHEYGAEQIQVLEGLEHVRKRPGMYIGSVSIRGLHHLVYEIVDNCVDEALAGYCTKINVEIEPGNIISVEDNGRGIPVDIHPKTKISAAETVYTKLNAGGKFGGDSGYKVSGGLHGVGASVVNALSTWAEVTIQRDGGIFQMKFERGKTVQPLTRIGDSKETGTKVRFLADDTIFETLEYDYETLENRFREMAFLTKGLFISIEDKRNEEEPKKAEFCFEGGLNSFVEYLNKNKEKINPIPVYIEKDGKLYMGEVGYGDAAIHNYQNDRVDYIWQKDAYATIVVIEEHEDYEGKVEIPYPHGLYYENGRWVFGEEDGIRSYGRLNYWNFWE